MSLKVWLPLNGDTNNYGIDTCQITTVGGVFIDNNGKIGKCYNFDGTGALTCSDWSSVQTMTFAAWIYANGSQDSDGAYIISLNTNAGYVDQALCIAMQGTNLVLEAGGNNKTHYTTGIINQWHHVAVTFNNGELKGYVNGEEVLSANNISFLSRSVLTIGARRSSSGCTRFFKGKLNDVRIYNNVLTPQEIKEIYKSLIIHYPLSAAPSSNLYQKPIRLPVEYQEVEYLEATGTQNIQNIIINQNDTVYFKAQTSSDITSEQGIIGSDASSKFEFYIKTNNIRAWSGCAFINPWTTTPVTTYQDFTVKGTITLADGSAINLFSYATNRLFFKGKVYFAKFYTSTGIQKYNFVPCYRKSDNKPGMYETVTKTFYVNSGSGEFIRGPACLSEDYIALDYLQSTGTQYIDTGVVANFNTKVKLLYQYTSIDSSTAVNALWGSMPSSSTVTPRIGLGQNATTGLFLGVNSTDVIDTANLNKHLIEFDLKNSRCTYDGIVKTFTKTGSAPTLTSYLFARHGTSPTLQAVGNVKIWYYIEYNNDIMVRNCIPVLRKSDKKPGMYDLINSVFYPNEGTGEFLYSLGRTTEYDISGFNNYINFTNDISNLINNGIPRYPILNKFNSTLAQAYKKSDFIYNGNIWSMSVWLNQSAIPASGWQCILSLHRNAGADADKKMNISITTDKIYIKIEDKYQYVTPLITTNQWYHFVITSDGTSGKIYINNELKYTLTLSSTIINCNYISLGALCASEGTNKIPSDVSLSDFRFYATCLSANDVAELYNMGRLS